MRAAKWLTLSIGGTLLLLLAALSAWAYLRERNVVAFCADIQPGVTVAQLVQLERRHGIDDSYLITTRFEDYADRTKSRELEYRDQMLDPNVACSISHDGRTVSTVDLSP